MARAREAAREMARPLYHFSEDPDIRVFKPRARSNRSGPEWLRRPLVWAVAESHAFLYLFPRDCPRILVWPIGGSTVEDVATWLPGLETDGWGAVAHVETAWQARLESAVLYRYRLPAAGFEVVGDVGMWVCRRPVRPLARETLSNLPGHLAANGVLLRVMADLTPLKGVWDSSLHASGIRLKNARGWDGV